MPKKYFLKYKVSGFSHTVKDYFTSRSNDDTLIPFCFFFIVFGWSFCNKSQVHLLTRKLFSILVAIYGFSSISWYLWVILPPKLNSTKYVRMTDVLSRAVISKEIINSLHISSSLKFGGYEILRSKLTSKSQKFLYFV